MIEDTTTLSGQITLTPNITTYMQIDKELLFTTSSKNFNYSSSIYESHKGVIADLEFRNNKETAKITLK